MGAHVRQGRRSLVGIVPAVERCLGVHTRTVGRGQAGVGHDRLRQRLGRAARCTLGEIGQWAGQSQCSVGPFCCSHGLGPV
jgi:hypothetical protein